MRIRDLAFKKAFAGLEASNRSFARGKCAVFDPADFAWTREVEARFGAIRAELDRLLGCVEALPNFQDIQDEQRHITDDDRWKIFPLWAYGVSYEPNLRRCPETAAALSLIPGMKTAMFSILRGPKRVPPHIGPFNGVLRYHLGLRVPGDPALCRIRVGTEWRSWAEGRSLVFDDTFQHEVIDDLPGARVVLFVDFLRPAPKLLYWANDRVVKAIGNSPFIQNALRKVERWNVDYEPAAPSGAVARSA
jgi:aspartyl/asparaginyl beta-hydroxylase (cupin superfamily)